MPKDWIIEPPWNERDRLARSLGISPIVAQVMHNRGVGDVSDARQFLDPQLGDMLPPEAMPATTEAAERIAASVAEGKKIVLYGDYDVDGITGVAILWHCLKLAGADVSYYIPDRLVEGYGVNTEAIETLAKDGAGLVITIDCGITAIEPARLARERGVEFIVTDHHTPHVDGEGQPQFPEALIVHPAVTAKGAADYPNPNLSGSGVALKLAWAVAQNFSRAKKVRPEFREFLVDALGLAALGIVADVVPLTGENRIIARHGLRGLPHSKLAGIRALIQSTRLTGKKLDGSDVGFKIAPRLNAIGRLGHARLAVEMLTRADADEAGRIARNLDEQNSKRQTLQRRISAEASALVVEQGQNEDTIRGIVLASEGWHAGVVGIVASKITEEFGRPTVMIAVENGIGQGSARSIPHFPLNEVLAECGDHLMTYGGHAMAAGLRIEAGKIDAFRAAFQERAGQRLTPADLRAKLHIDDVIRLGELNRQLVDDLAKLEPYGAGNPGPMLATDWLELAGEPRTVGSSGTHLQVRLGDGRVQCRGIAFGMGKYADPLRDHRRCRVAFRPTLNHWQGNTTVEMQIVDFRFPE